MAANKKTSSRLVDFLLSYKPSKMASLPGLEPATPGVTGRPRFNREQPTELSPSGDQILDVKKPAQGWLFCLLSHKPSKMAERTGLEPATPGVTGRYSNRLNYRSALE